MQVETCDDRDIRGIRGGLCGILAERSLIILGNRRPVFILGLSSACHCALEEVNQSLR